MPSATGPHMLGPMHIHTIRLALVTALLNVACGGLPTPVGGIIRSEDDDRDERGDGRRSGDTGAANGVSGPDTTDSDATGSGDTGSGDTGSGDTGAGPGSGSVGGSNVTPEPQPEGEPLAEPIPGCAPAPLPSTGDFGGDCVRRINQLRLECQNLPPLARNADAEVCADMQAADDARTGVPHGAFSSGMCNGGWGQNECPGWPGDPHDVMNGCLQMMWDEGPGPFWEGHGHYVNMTNPSFTSVACGVAVTESGLVWSVQNFM